MLAERVLEWTAQWKAEGLAEGFAKGTAKGMAGILHLQLQSRFGDLPEWVLARLQNASEDELARWSLRILSQTNLQDILT